MRVHPVVMALLVLAAGCAAPVVAIFGTGTEPLVEQTRRLNQAFAVRDSRTIESMLAPDYTFHFVDRNVQAALQATPNAPRGRWIGAMFESLSNGPLSSSVIDARVHGQIGVTVTAYEWSGSFGSAAFEYSGYITDVWVRRGGRWWLLSSTATALPPR